MIVFAEKVKINPQDKFLGTCYALLWFTLRALGISAGSETPDSFVL